VELSANLALLLTIASASLSLVAVCLLIAANLLRVIEALKL